MRKKLILLLIIFGFNNIFSQDFNKCKVDFHLFDEKDKFDKNDIGKEYILRLDNFPDYNLRKDSNRTYQQVKVELTEKLKENREYNKDNEAVKDSLIEYYTDIAHNIGVNIVWWSKWKVADKDELKDYKKRKNAYNRKAKIGLIPKGAVIDKDYKSTSYYERTSGYGRYWDSSITLPEIISDSVQISNDYLYKKEQKRIRDDLPIFWVYSLGGDEVKISYDNSNREFNFPIGVKPVFEFNEYENTVFSLVEIKKKNHLNAFDKLVFHTKELALNVINYKYQKNYEEPLIDKSVGLFFDKKRLTKIDELLNSLMTKNITIENSNSILKNPKIEDISFDFKSINISYLSNNSLHKIEFHLNDNISNNKITLPIYYTDCYNEQLIQFNNLKLPKDFYSNLDLKRALKISIQSEPKWVSYQINKIILTNKSNWVIKYNKITGLKDSRFMLADVYFKNVGTKKCFLQQEVLFLQKLDPLNEYVHPIIPSLPQNFKPYPCNLK